MTLHSLSLLTRPLTGLAIALTLAGCATPPAAPSAGIPAQHDPSNATQPVVARADIAQGVYELVYSDKQGVLFVASAGSFKDPSVPSRILVVNPADLKVIDAIPLQRKAFSLALDDANDRLYVGHTGQGAVAVVDTRTRQVQAPLQLVALHKGKDSRERPAYHFRQLQLDTENHRLYMAGFDNTQSELFVIDTRDWRVAAKIPGFGFTATGIALDARHNRLYVSNMQGEAIVVDTTSNKIIDRFDLGVEQPLNLAYDDTNHRLLVVDQGHPKMTGFQQRGIPGFQSRHPGNRVVAIDLASRKPIAEMPAQGPINLKLDTARQRLYVTNRTSGEVSVFDSNDYRKLHAIRLPAHPNTLALNARTGEMFVSVKNEEDAPDPTESVARIAF